MPPIFGRLTLACAAAAAAVALGAHAQEPPRLDWQVERWEGQLQLTLSYRTEHGSSVNSHPAQLSDLPGLSGGQLTSPALTNVRFVLRRDAGEFDCDGSAKAGHASGSCDFRPDPAFAALLKARGVGAAEPADLFRLAYVDIGRDYLDELSRQRYPTPSIEDLRRAGEHGVKLAYLRELGAAGYRSESLAGLVRLRDHGVGLRYIQELRDAGYTRIALEDLVRARDHGVSGRFAAEFAERGYRDLPVDTLIRLRDHGVTAAFADRANGRAAVAPGGRLSPEELIRLRDTGELYRASVRRER